MRGLVSLLVIASILVAALVLMLRVPALRDSLVPTPVLSYLQDRGVLEAIGADEGVTIAARTAGDFLADTFAGLVATGPIAASAGNAPVFVDEVITGYSTRSSGAVPAEITTIRPILGCRLTRPMPGTVVGHVTAGKSGMPIGMMTYSDAHLATAVRDYVEAYRTFGPGAEIPIEGPSFQAYDLAVTETTAPVYLVLENHGGNRIWNIHAAQGVRIERVILLGGDQVGVANLDPVVPVEVILDAGLADCGIEPAYLPTAGQLADADPAEGAQPMSQSAIQAAQTRAEVYDTWFRDSFGLKAGDSRIGYDEGTISLVGPVPSGEAPRAIWASIDGAKLRTTHDQFLDIDGQVAPGQDFAARVIAITTKFAFGDLNRLRQGGSF